MGSGEEDADSLEFTIHCELEVDCTHPEAQADNLLEGREDDFFTTTSPSIMTMKGAFPFSDNAWTSSFLSGVVDTMEDRLWLQEANIKLDLATYELDDFPGSWEPWNGAQEWDHFMDYLHGRQSVPSSYTSDFSGLLNSIISSDRAMFIQYFASNNGGGAVGTGSICQPGTWSSYLDYSVAP